MLLSSVEEVVFQAMSFQANSSSLEEQLKSNLNVESLFEKTF